MGKIVRAVQSCTELISHRTIVRLVRFVRKIVQKYDPYKSTIKIRFFQNVGRWRCGAGRRKEKKSSINKFPKILQISQNFAKKQKMHVRFQNSCKKRAKMEKRTQIYVDFFRVYIPYAFFAF